MATTVRATGRGLFFTVTALYLSMHARLTVGEIAWVLAGANLVGLLASYLGGALADRFPPARLIRGSFVAEGLALASYGLVSNQVGALVVACAVTAFNRGGASAMSAFIAGHFTGGDRVTTRARIRTALNIGMAAGGGLSALVIVLQTRLAFQLAMLAGGCAYVAAGFICDSLPTDQPQGAPQTRRPMQTDERAAGQHPLRDGRYMLLTGLSGVFALQFIIAEVAMPLWITQHTTAPAATIPALLLINTAVVVLLQVRLSRGTHDPVTAGRSVRAGGLLLAASCLIMASSAGVADPVWAAATLVLGGCALSLGEVMQQAGDFSVSFEFANPHRAGTYQGFYALGQGAAQTLGPLVIAHTIFRDPLAGWLGLAVAFLSAGGLVAMLCRHHTPAYPRAVAQSSISAPPLQHPGGTA